MEYGIGFFYEGSIVFFSEVLFGFLVVIIDGNEFEIFSRWVGMGFNVVDDKIGWWELWKELGFMNFGKIYVCFCIYRINYFLVEVCFYLFISVEGFFL